MNGFSISSAKKIGSIWLGIKTKGKRRRFISFTCKATSSHQRFKRKIKLVGQTFRPSHHHHQRWANRSGGERARGVSRKSFLSLWLKCTNSPKAARQFLGSETTWRETWEPSTKWSTSSTPIMDTEKGRGDGLGLGKSRLGPSRIRVRAGRGDQIPPRSHLRTYSAAGAALGAPVPRVHYWASSSRGNFPLRKFLSTLPFPTNSHIRRW